MAERVQVRDIDDDERQRLLRIVRRGTGSVVTWRRAQMVLLSAQGVPPARIAEVTFTSADRVRDVIRNFGAPALASCGILYGDKVNKALLAEGCGCPHVVERSAG
jgi:hypothetical protein